MSPRWFGLVLGGAFALTSIVTAAPVSAESPSCRAIPGSKDLLRAGRVVLLGEQHGTAQSPAFVLDLACHAVNAGLAVRVGIEMPESERSRVDAFLASPGDDASRKALLAGPRWQSDYQYGQTSEAIYGLLDGLRVLRRQDPDLRVVLFDQPGDGGGQARDRRMAEHLAGVLAESKEAVLLVLTGNIHSRVAPGTRWDSDYKTMGSVLSGAVSPERIVALDVAHAGGTAWVCLGSEVSDCGMQGFRARGPDGEGITLDASPESTGHHGWYHVGSITASPPARDARASEEPENEPGALAAGSGSKILWQFESGG